MLDKADDIIASMNTLVRQTQQFTLGFLNKRVLINELLTDDNSLSRLEGEFYRRGIGAITFSAGITLSEFKHGLTVVCTRPKFIEENGGINLDHQSQVPNRRVGAGVREQHFWRFDGQQPHRRGSGTKLYRSFYMR
jgi:hypothetical protein